MKKLSLSILGLMLAFSGFAKEVSQDEASRVALRLMAEKEVSVNSVTSVSPVQYEGETAYYVVNFAPQGWALVSADDVATPLIGYSDKGVFPMSSMPDNMKGWLDINAEQILKCSKVSGKRNGEWDKTSTSIKTKATTKATDKIAPIIAVNWNQGNPYNKYCPSNSQGTAVVGCVAVAMAQAMSVAQYPPRPEGTKSYNSGSVYGNISINYNNEPAYNWSNIMSGANSKDDVARLLWHCGMATEMQYGPGGSGTQTSIVPGALKKYFGYPQSVTYVERKKYNDNNWNSLLLTELSEGRAVVYCGYPEDGTAGHCFNLDGYDGAFYHVNWGWGGAGDGYYSLDKLAAQVVIGGEVMKFTIGHGMVIGVRAPSTQPTNISLSNTTVMEKQPAGTVVGAVTVESDVTDAVYTYKVQGKKTVFGYAKAPFEVVNGNLVTTEVLAAADYVDVVTGNSLCNITITATNSLEESVSRTFNITIKTSSAIEDITLDENAPVEYYNLQGVKVENPTQGLYIKKQGTKTSKVIL